MTQREVREAREKVLFRELATAKAKYEDCAPGDAKTEAGFKYKKALHRFTSLTVNGIDPDAHP